MATTDRYASPQLECDLVMKGGITSGVVYPLAVCRLAERYHLRNIGGASAGAIAAVAAGAAEYGRATRSPRAGAGFPALETLPQRLTESVGPAQQPRLLSLFQPTAEARAIFRLLLVFIGRAAGWRKAIGAAAVVIGACPESVLLGAVAAGLLVALGGIGRDNLLGSAAVLAGALSLLVLGLLIAAARFVWAALSALGPDHRYGICPGFSSDAATGTEPPLTRWLTDVLDELAGVTGTATAPITFGDLSRHQIELALMTTDLTHGRPYRLPFREADGTTFFFKERDFRALFPAAVVDRMVQGAHARLNGRDGESPGELQKLKALHATLNAARGGGDYLPFPDLDHLPLVVGARMSLSFPVLLQAVPLFAVDWTLKANQDRTPELERCWFSDGGICSNLPIHFFDALLPRRPTFALSLKSEHPDYPVQSPPFAPGKSERDNVWIPRDNAAGTASSWNRFDQGPAKFPLFKFLFTIVDTMQCWNDNLTIRYPGYRDRIVQISHSQNEGGMNLNMPKEIIERLANRGAAAGEVLRHRFDPATGTAWSNHLWIRYRTLLAMLSDQTESLACALDPNQNQALTELFDAPPSYRFENQAQARAAAAVNRSLSRLAADLSAADPQLSTGAPNPRADLRGRPRSG